MWPCWRPPARRGASAGAPCAGPRRPPPRPRPRAVPAAPLLRTRREEADERRRRELTPVVHALLDGDGDGDGGPRPDVAGAPAALEDVAVRLLPQARGGGPRGLP